MYRGWSVVGTTMATQAVQAGLLIYGFSAIALPLEQEFGVSRLEVMIAATCLSLASSGLAPLAGHWADKHSIRRLMLAGALALALGMAVVASAQALWQVWLAYALLLPLANVLLGQLTSAALVTRWFKRRRGRAMGLSAMGTSIGGFLFPVMIAAGAEGLGWRGALMLIALISALLLAGLVVIGISNEPGAGIPDDERIASSVAASASAAAPPTGTIEIIAKPAFWIITFGVGIKIATYFGLINNLGGLAQDVGVGAVEAAGLVSVLSLASMAGKLGFGTLAERFSPQALFISALGFTIISFGLLLVAHNFALLFVSCLLLGLATGGMLPLWSLIIGQYFSEASFGRALGLTNLAMVPLTAAASPVAGWAHDRTGSYDTVIWGSIAALFIAIVLLLALPRVEEAQGS